MRQRLRSAELRGALQLLQFASSVVFVCLYVASTYSTPAPFSWRYNIDILLCLLFAADYVARVVVLPPAEAQLVAQCSYGCVPASRAACLAGG